MAIGKQGAYATVQGGAVDFGKITTDAIDKYQAQQALQEKLKQDKAAAKAKAVSDEVKNLRVMSKYSSSGMKEIDDPALLLVGQYANALSEFGEKVEAGEASSLQYNQVVGQADQAVEVMSQAAKYAVERSQAYAKLADEGKLNENFVDPDKIKNVMKDSVPVLDENGSITYNYKDSDGNIIKTENPKEIIDKVFGNPVLKVDLNDELKKVKDVLEQDKIATAGSKFVVTETEQSKRFLSGASKSAIDLLSNRNTKAALWSDYESTLPENKRVGPKADGFSEEQNKALYDYTNNKIIEMYPKEKSLANIPKSGGSGGGGGGDNKGKFTPQTYDPSQSFGFYGKRANGMGITVSDASDKKNQVILSSIPKGKSGDGKGSISNALVTDIMYDGAGRMIASMTYIDWKSAKLTKQQKQLGIQLMEQDGFDDIESIADKLGVSSATLAEQRKVLVQPLGKAAQAKVLGKLGLTEAQLKAQLGYSNKPATKTDTTKKTGGASRFNKK